MSDFATFYADAFSAGIGLHHGETVVYRRENGEETDLTNVPVVDPADAESAQESRGPEPIVVEVAKSDLTDGIELHGDRLYWNSRWYRIKAIESEDSATWVVRCAPCE